MSRRSILSLAGAALVSLSLVATAAAQTTTGTASAEASAAQARRAAQVQDIELNKSGFINELLAKWSDEASAKGYDAYWTKGYRNLLRRSAEDLLRLSERATDFDTFDKLVFKGYTIDAFGDLTQDLVFFPVAPCRLLDTRVPTNTAPYQGPKAPGTEVAFSVNDSLGPQGGNGAGCGIPSSDPPALSVVITAVPTDANVGNLRSFPTGGTVPTASVVNYQGGVTIAAGTITASCTACGDELTVRNQGLGTTHVVVDVTGYFAPPSLSPVDNNVLFTETSIAASATFNIFSPTCPATWRLSGGGYVGQSFSGPTFIGSRPVQGGSAALVTGVNLADTWLCQGTNGAAVQLIRCFAVCTRVP